MICPHCHIESALDAQFCVHCGTKLTVSLLSRLSPKTIDDLRAAESPWCQSISEESLPKIVQLACGPVLRGVGKEFLEQLALRSALTEIGGAAVPHLIAALDKPDLQSDAFHILGDIGAPAVPALVRLLGDDRLGPRVGLELLKIGAGAVPELTRALSDERAAARAIIVLGDIGPAAIPAVETWARQADPNTIGRAAKVFTRIGPPARSSLQRLLAENRPHAEEFHAAYAALTEDPRSTVLDLSGLSLAARVEAVDRLPADVISLFREIHPEPAGYRYRVHKLVWQTPRSRNEAQALDITGKLAFGIRIALSPDPWCWSVDVGWMHRTFMPRLYAWKGFQLTWQLVLISLPLQWWFQIWPTWGAYWLGLLQVVPGLLVLGFLVGWMLHYGLMSRRLRRQALPIELLLCRSLQSSVVFREEIRQRLEHEGVAPALRQWGEKLSSEWDEGAWAPAPEFSELSRLRRLRWPVQPAWRPWPISDDQRFALRFHLRQFTDAAVATGERHSGRHSEIAAATNFFRIALRSPHYQRPYHVGVFLAAADDRALVLELIAPLLLFQARNIGLVYVAAGHQGLEKAKRTLKPLVDQLDKPPEIRFQTWQEVSLLFLNWKVVIYELDIDPDDTAPSSSELPRLGLKARWLSEKAAAAGQTWSVFLIQFGRQRLLNQSIELGIPPAVGGDER
jgi:hypothetical protein